MHKRKQLPVVTKVSQVVYEKKHKTSLDSAIEYFTKHQVQQFPQYVSIIGRFPPIWVNKKEGIDTSSITVKVDNDKSEVKVKLKDSMDIINRFKRVDHYMLNGSKLLFETCAEYNMSKQYITEMKHNEIKTKPHKWIVPVYKKDTYRCSDTCTTPHALTKEGCNTCKYKNIFNSNLNFLLPIVSDSESQNCFNGITCSGCKLLSKSCLRCIDKLAETDSEYCNDCNSIKCIICWDSKREKCPCPRIHDDIPMCLQCRVIVHKGCSRYLRKCNGCHELKAIKKDSSGNPCDCVERLCRYYCDYCKDHFCKNHLAFRQECKECSACFLATYVKEPFKECIKCDEYVAFKYGIEGLPRLTNKIKNDTNALDGTYVNSAIYLANKCLKFINNSHKVHTAEKRIIDDFMIVLDDLYLI